MLKSKSGSDILKHRNKSWPEFVRNQIARALRQTEKEKNVALQVQNSMLQKS